MAKKKNKVPSTQPAAEAAMSVRDFVTALAKSSASSDAVPTQTTKAERIAKRQAKRQRKQQELEQRRAQKKRKEDPIQKTAPTVVNHRKRQRQERLLRLYQEAWASLVTLHADNPKYSPAIQTSDKKARNYLHTVQHKKMKTATLLEPRKSDYGGLGLARPTLYLEFADPSWQPRLEEAFVEHVPGWSGKPPMMQAMKRQRDSNLLWKRLQREKQNTGKSKQGRHLTPDERVEAMLKSEDLV